MLDVRLAREPSGRVRTATITTAAGETVVSGRRPPGLGLRSTWFTPSARSRSTRPGTPAVYGRPVVLVGRGRAPGGSCCRSAWTASGSRCWRATRPARSRSRRSSRPDEFRLAAGALTGPTLTLPVAPRVRVSREPAALAGTVVPPAPGAAVDVQRLEGESWTSAGRALVDEPGPSVRSSRSPPGTYRARVAPAGGYAAGLSRASHRGDEPRRPRRPRGRPALPPGRCRRPLRGRRVLRADDLPR